MRVLAYSASVEDRGHASTESGDLSVGSHQKIICQKASIYFSDGLHFHTPSRQLSSSADTQMFRIPSLRTKSSGQRSFSYQAAVIWNQIPVSLHHSTYVSSFKSSLKTFWAVSLRPNEV